MKSSATFSALAAAWGLCTLSSCVYIPFNQLIPDTATSVPQQPQTPAILTQTPAATATTTATAAAPQMATQPQAPAAQPKQTQTPATTQNKPATTQSKPATTKAATKPSSSTITQAPKTTSAEPKKEAKPAAPAKVSITTPTNRPDQKPDLSSITNENGYIPYAVRVPGDPTRVYNPLAPQKTIRILDKNGNPYPKDTQLKVKGTNFKFKIP